MANRAYPTPPSGIGYDPDTDLRWQPAPQTLTELPSTREATLSTGEPTRMGNDRSTVHQMTGDPRRVR